MKHGIRENAYWHRRVLLAPVLLFALLVGALLYRGGRQALSSLADLLEPTLERALGRDVEIGRVQLRGWGTLTVNQVAIADGPTFASGTLLRARRTTIHLDLVDILRHRRLRPGDWAGAH